MPHPGSPPDAPPPAPPRAPSRAVRRLLAAALACAFASGGRAHADGPSSEPVAGAAHAASTSTTTVASSAPSAAPHAGPLPALAALGPGLVVSGTGTWLAGDRRTARKLAWMQLGGLGMMAAGGLPLLASGASRRVSGFTLPVVFAGGGVFVGSWLADLFAAATGGTDGTPFRPRRGLELGAGTAYVRDPQFDYAAFAVLDADLRWGRDGRWRATGAAWLALDDDTQRLRGELARRWTSPRDGSFVEIVGAATVHRQAPGVQVWTGEAAALARLDMRRVGRSLRGSFFELGAGLGLETYRIDGHTSALDLPLLRAAYGIDLGRGELRLFYDHRHDTFSGGLGTGATFDGPWGYVGAEGFYYLTDRWGLELQLTAGSAHTARVGALWRM